MKIFLSSTGRDLSDYRKAVDRCLSKVKGYECIKMEDFGARTDDPLTTCINELKNCELFVGIIGQYFGSSPSNDNRSYTQCEFDAASEYNIPKLMYVTPEDFPIPSNLREDDEKWEKQQLFRKKVKSTHTIDKAETPDGLANKILIAIQNSYSGLKIYAPLDKYVTIIERDNGTQVSIDEIKKDFILHQFESGSSILIKKIYLVRVSVNKIYEFDFSKGLLPKGIEFERLTSAFSLLGNSSMDQEFDFDEPRFIKLIDDTYALLLEPGSTNLIENSSTEERQVIVLGKGEYTFYFEGEKYISLKGAINSDVKPNSPFTFIVSSEQHTTLIVQPIGRVKHIQLEKRSSPTSKITTTVCPVSRVADQLRIKIDNIR